MVIMSWVMLIMLILVIVLAVVLSESGVKFYMFIVCLLVASASILSFSFLIFGAKQLADKNRAIELNYAEYDKKTGEFKWLSKEGKYIITGYKETK